MAQQQPTVNLNDVVKNHASPPPCDSLLKIDIIEAVKGQATAIWQPDASFVNGVGVVMGGFVSSAADVAMAYAVASILNEKQTFGSIHLHTTFHRPVFPGRVTVIANVKKQGRSVSYVEAELFQRDRLVATSVSSVIIKEIN
ncbi:PaaI family thioesterase [Halalkalibacterium halodurans]|uniref:BH0206 protein n=1 Tax=Halalkalibacterium halodurans (strain ATCC BAA-125 / DSM 18197 / FERM 7344 / JCM 9153 / C-125) TaxID=272558 RepID=Q9KGA6_HALH5|nr:PaaI family thioesterase [Halalkalibacterium halodurans]MDY7220714.1 PaaI family thioesterase [Halalkalibacterium halodurans]MDY7239953.1 PaaI family thioesterase [Halalkalibacterium halodurans]MED4081305.1 PaaI family thioesterase [Halalkalibacterium halodurans]MED4084020.1 PaaI family thioesterase [Halalkalibacterium halodurans]MED4105975.1 PaaI family thioesterase [Halalkalibacterium halodurans]